MTKVDLTAGEKPSYTPEESRVYRLVVGALKSIEDEERETDEAFSNLALMLGRYKAEMADVRLVFEDLYPSKPDDVESCINLLEDKGFRRDRHINRMVAKGWVNDDAQQRLEDLEGRLDDIEVEEAPMKLSASGPPDLPKGYLGKLRQGSCVAAVLVGEKLTSKRLLSAYLEVLLRSELDRKPQITVIDYVDERWNGLDRKPENNQPQIVWHVAFEGKTPLDETIKVLDPIYKQLKARQKTSRMPNATSELMGEPTDYPPLIVVINGLSHLDQEIKSYYTTPMQRGRDSQLRWVRRVLKELLMNGPKYDISVLVGSSTHQVPVLLPEQLMNDLNVALVGGPNGSGSTDYRAVDKAMLDTTLLPSHDDRRLLRETVAASRSFNMGVILLPGSPPLLGQIQTHSLGYLDTADFLPYLDVLAPFKIRPAAA